MYNTHITPMTLNDIEFEESLFSVHYHIDSY